MSKLSQMQKDLIKLILRSKPGEDGWYFVSELLWPSVNEKLPDDLAEFKPEGSSGFVRLTSRGLVVADYL